MTNGNDLINASFEAEYHQNGDGIAYLNSIAGLTKRELIFTNILCAYISAGSNGMPDVESLIKYAEETYNAALNHLNKQP